MQRANALCLALLEVNQPLIQNAIYEKFRFRRNFGPFATDADALEYVEGNLRGSEFHCPIAKTEWSK